MYVIPEVKPVLEAIEFVLGVLPGKELGYPQMMGETVRRIQNLKCVVGMLLKRKGGKSLGNRARSRRKRKMLALIKVMIHNNSTFFSQC